MFKEWPKIPRYKGLHVIITEKIDGTNACVINDDLTVVGTQSRSKIITPENDNYGFANWVKSNGEVLVQLGRGYHYGEWAGPGIQKNPLNLEHKTFFLFNTKRWTNPEIAPYFPVHPQLTTVPVLYEGDYSEVDVNKIMVELRERRIKDGQFPEGIVLYFPVMDAMMKYTYDHQEGKWKG